MRNGRTSYGLSKLLVVAVVCAAAFDAGAQVTPSTPIFGPTTYTRTTGAPNQYTTTFTLPAWIANPYDLHIVNGSPTGSDRISSATITLNGVQVAGPSDFNQNVATIDRSVTLQATNTLQVTLASKPGSYLTINVFGTSADHTPPTISIVRPAANTYINTATPSLQVTYSDTPGTGESAASGVKTSTFKATLDGVDRTSLFTVRSGDASATIPGNLALSAGSHSLTIILQDTAGNQATATSQFTVSLSVPQIQVVQPVLGSYLNTTTPTVSIQYSDSSGINPSTLKVTINGVDRTQLFTANNTGATAALPAGTLAQGANQIVAQIQNLAGNSASASTSFNIDTNLPTISFSRPASNSYQGSSTVGIQVQYSDDQAIDSTKLKITLDGVALSATVSPTSASATATGITNGAHQLVASIKDLAGNASTSQITFYVDTSVPSVHVQQPAPGTILNTALPQVSIAYADVVGVDSATFKVFVNGVDATSLFTIGPATATAQLTSAFKLPDGQNTITAQIANLAGTSGSATSTFTVDTTPPTLAFQAPSAKTNSGTPATTIVYSDATSGVDPYSLVVTLDGADVSALVAPGANSATGVLQVSPPLTDGTHQLSATVKDRAGNRSQAATLSFVVDTKAPTVSFTVPLDNSFIHSPTPSITLQYSDGTGTGIDTSSVEILLQQGANPPTDITSSFQLGPQQATGAIPSASSLNDGTYVLTAVVNDVVGNTSNARATFVVDTVAPIGSIQAPAANAILNTSTVSVILPYQDDRSGVDTSKLLLTVDGVNQTSVLTLTPTQATGTLPPLPDGVHTIQLTVFDRAGNSTAVMSQTFTTDTTAPAITASIVPAPNTAGWNNNSVTVVFTCLDSGSGVTTCPAPVAVAGEGAGQSYCGQAVDAAGNSSLPACATVNIDKTPPVISYVISPAPNAAGINTTIPVTITFSCTDVPSGVASCPASISVTTLGLNQTFSGTATDVAGNSATVSVKVSVQTQAPTPPSITAVVTPAPNAAGWNNSTVTVSFTCAAGTNSLTTCPGASTVTTEGAHQSICGTAVDSAGLTATTCATVNLDETPPSISATASPTASASGWNATPVTVTFTCADSVSGIATCPPLQTFSTDGAGQTATGTAVDAAGNSAVAHLTLNIDQTPPSILQFTAPTQLAPGQASTATVSASDNIGVSAVVIQLNGATIGTFTAPPYSDPFTVPTTATAGTTLTLAATVTDPAGNTNGSARGIQVVSSGVVMGQVLSDVTSLPLAGASVQILGGGGQDTSDGSGRYSIAPSTSHFLLNVTVAANAAAGTPAMVTVEREVFLQSGVGTVPVDTRMTPISPAVAIGTGGGTLTAGATTITVAPGAVSSTTNFHLTQLSQQGLPELLPLGWSPASSFDLRADTSTSVSFSAAFTQLPSSGVLHLVRYDYSTHAWLMVAPNLGAGSGSLTVPIPSVGEFALITEDIGNSITIPAVGQPLTGTTMVTLPAGALASGSLNPPSVSPKGGTSVATLSVQSSVPLPSGTVIQANVQETYALTTGKKLSQAKRAEDIVLYQFSAPSGAAGVATFPVTPSQTFQPQQFSSGNVHLDILAGRESIRGVVGGSEAVSATGGDATLTVAAGSLPADTAIAVAPEAVEGFLPATSSLLPLAEYYVDFSGQILNSPAQLSVAAGTAHAGDTVFLAQIQRVNGVPYLVVVSLAQATGTTLVTQGATGLSGITQGGDYIFYKLTAPAGYVAGTVTASAGPVAAMVQTDGLPFVSFANSSGSYIIPALAGAVQLTASVPNTALAGTATAQVTAGQTATANLTVVGQVESAIVTPPNGAVGVPLTAEIDITAADMIDPSSVTITSVTLTQNGQAGSPIPIRFVFSTDGMRLSVFPITALQPSTTYTLAASAIANILGGLIQVPTVTFTTQAVTQPNFNTNALVFAMPDQNGNVQVSAPANSFPPGTTILIVDETNGVVISLTVANDGSVTGQFPASIDDVLAVTITAPDKTTVSFVISQYVAPDGTTAIGAGGGTVTGPGNTAILIPQGALPKGTTFKLTQLDQTAFPVLPTWPGLNFGSGLRITDPAMPTFKKEAKLAFPVPANAPKNAFYYVYRRLTDQNGKAYFETIDHAFLQDTGATAEIVTASPPFCGYHNSFGNFNAAAGASPRVPVPAPFQDYILMWDTSQPDPNIPGVASSGLLVGLAEQIVPAVPGVSPQTTQPAQGTVNISLDSNPDQFAIYDGVCATFTLFDPQFGGGLRNLTATQGTTTLKVSAQEVNGVQGNDSAYGITASLERQYRNIGRVNFLFPPPIPPPAPPQLSVRVFTLDGNGHRVPAPGILQTGTNIVIAFQSKLAVESASIGTIKLAVQKSDSAEEVSDGKPEQYLQSSRVTGIYGLGTAGTYAITATAVDPISATQVTASQSVLVVAAGGSDTSTITCTAAPPPAAPTAGCTLPQVINEYPVPNATGVSTNAFPQVTFNEPVTNIPGNVVLADHAGAVVSVRLVGVRPPDPNNPGLPPSVADPVQPADTITSLTIQPLNGLNYSETYTLTVNASGAGCTDGSGNPIPQQSGSALIVDKNNPPTGPLCLQPFPKPGALPYKFTTLGPQPLGGAGSQYPVFTRPVIIGERAYAGEYVNTAINALGDFDITDPTNPVDLGAKSFFQGRVIDVAGQDHSPATGNGLVAVATGTVGSNLTPANVWLYDVASPDQPARVGAVSVTSSVNDGIPLRLFMKDQFLYASTYRHGLQVIDLGQALTEYSQIYNFNPTQFAQAVTIEGNGFAMDTIVNTISLPTFSSGTATMFDLKADDFSSTSGSQTLLVATGQLPLVVADPTLSGSPAVLYPQLSGGIFATDPVQPLLLTSPDGKTNSLLCYGGRVALGTIPVTDASGFTASKHIGVVTGLGGSGPAGSTTSCPANGSGLALAPALMVVDFSQTYAQGSPFTPTPTGFVQLPTSATDVILQGTIALVSTGTNILLINLENPTHPLLAGQITGNFGNGIALTDTGIIITSSPTPSSGSVETAEIASPCASARKTLKNNPPNTGDIHVTPSGKLTWSMSAGVSNVTSPSGASLSRDGLVLTNVNLGRRTLAKMMSLPYLLLGRSDADKNNPARCELSANGGGACTGLGSGFPGRSQLTRFEKTTSSDGTYETVLATYLIDQLDGDAEKDTTRPDSCVLLTQSYKFTQEGLKPFEPNGKLATGLFFPTVHYSHFTDSGGPQLKSLTTAQRFQFDARSMSAQSKWPANATLLTCDHDIPVSSVPSCGRTSASLLSFPDPVGIFGRSEERR